MINNKGFTLIEALAVIVVLGLVLAIGGYSVANYLNKTRENSLIVFKENIKSGMINYYNECKYLSTGVCSDLTDVEEEEVIIGYKLETTIGELAEYGFIENQGNNEETGTLIIKDPIDEGVVISTCNVSITYYTDKYNDEEGKQQFSDVEYSGDCGSLETNEDE